MGIKSGWFKVSDSPASPAVDSDIPSTDDATHEPGAELAQAGSQDDKRPETRSGAAATEPDPGSAVYREADRQARGIAAEQVGLPSKAISLEQPEALICPVR